MKQQFKTFDASFDKNFYLGDSLDGRNDFKESKEIHFEYKQEILEGVVGIESIINNLVMVLEELRKSITSQNSLNIMKSELETLKEASNKVSDKTDVKHIDQENAIELSNELQLIIGKVQILTLDLMRLNDEMTSTSVKEEELSNLLLNCKKIGSSLDSHITIQDRTKTPPSSPVLKEETTNKISEPIASLVAHVVSSESSFHAEQNQESIDLDEEKFPSIEGIDSQELDDSSQDEKKGLFSSIKQKVANAFTKEQEPVEKIEPVEPEQTKPNSSLERKDSGFMSSIKMRVGGFFSSYPESKSDDDQEVEEDIEGIFIENLHA